MYKICKSLVLLTIIGVMVIGLGAFSSNLNSSQPYLKQPELEFSPSSIHTGHCSPNRSEGTLSIEALDISALDLVLVIDFSHKAYREIGNKLDLVTDFVDQVAELPSQIGLVPLGGQEKLVIPLTADSQTIKDKIMEITPAEVVPSLGKGLEKAIAVLDQGRADAAKMVVAITAHGAMKEVVVPTDYKLVKRDIIAFTLGAGDFSPPPLKWIAEKTDGAFYSGLSSENLDKINEGIKEKLEGVVARDLIATVTLSDHAFIEKSPEGCRRGSSRKQMVCEIKELKKGEEKELKFKIGSRRKEAIDAKVELEYMDPGGNEKTIEREYTQIVKVPNHPPSAEFEWEVVQNEGKQRIIVDDEIQFRDKSSDCDGHIQKRQWDFGDGATETGKSPVHKYDQPGTYRVCLAVTDDSGATRRSCQSIKVLEPLTATREISYFTPSEVRLDEELGALLVSDDYNQAYQVTLQIEASTELWGLMLEEEITEKLAPSQYEIQILDGYSDDCSPIEGGIRCRFRTLEPGTYKISYQLKFKEEVEPGIYKINGRLSTFEPFLTHVAVTGKQQMEIINCLSAIRAVYCWDAYEGGLSAGLCKKDKILSDQQLEQARIWWFDGASVPGTCGEAIGDELMRHILYCSKNELTTTECIGQWEEKQQAEQEQAAKVEAICINQATRADLEEIEGIGSATASNILEFLPVKDWESLLEANGVGEKTLEAIKKQFSLC